MKILSWNVNGLRAAHKKGFLDWVAAESPDIICVQETKAWRSQLPEALTDLNGYYAYFGEAESKGYSGVGLWSKKKPKKTYTSIGIDRFDREGRIIRADFSDFILFNVYFPNGKASEKRLEYKLDFYNAFLEYTRHLDKKGKKLIICGDVNTAHKEIDLARPKANERFSGFLPVERDWIDRFLSAGFLDTFRVFNEGGECYTWWDLKTRSRERNVGWRIDYFFISKALKKDLLSAFILADVKGSDHCPTGIEIAL